MPPFDSGNVVAFPILHHRTKSVLAKSDGIVTYAIEAKPARPTLIVLHFPETGECTVLPFSTERPPGPALRFPALDGTGLDHDGYLSMQPDRASVTDAVRPIPRGRLSSGVFRMVMTQWLSVMSRRGLGPEP